MGEVTLKSLLYAGLLFGLFITGVVVLINNIQNGTALSNADETVDNFIQGDELTLFNNSFNTMGDTIDTIGGIQTNLSQANVGSTGVATLALSFVSSAWGSVKLLFGSFGFVTSIFNSMINYLGGGVLGFVSSFITALLGVVIIFGIINLIFGRND